MRDWQVIAIPGSLANSYRNGVKRVAVERPSPPNEKQLIFRVMFWLGISLALVLVSLFLLGDQPYLFLLILTLGIIAGLLHARGRYPVWQRVLKTGPPRQAAKWYVGCGYFLGFLLLLYAPVIANYLVEPLKTIFVSVLLGVPSGYLVGYHLWLAGLYARRNAAKPS
jgi:hypothetical protein